MKATNFLAASLASSAMALNITEQYGVIETITTWLGDIDTVNLFLERAAGLDSSDLKIEAQIAWTRAEDEPVQLGNLKDLRGLSKTGQEAASELANVFSAIPGNLTDIIVHAGSSSIVKEDLANINYLRCNVVLPDIDILWLAAAELANWTAVPTVPRPTTCTSSPVGTSPSPSTSITPSPSSCSGNCGSSKTQIVSISVSQSMS